MTRLYVTTRMRIQNLIAEGDDGAAEVSQLLGWSALGIGLIVTLYGIFTGRATNLVNGIFDQITP